MAQGKYSVSLPFAHHNTKCFVHINSQARFTPVKWGRDAYTRQANESRA